MKEGLYKKCCCCGKTFRYIDGDYTCSQSCDEIEERQEAEEYAKKREH